MLQLRDGPFTRPHPGVWRIVLGASVVYLLGLVFVLFLSPKDARQWMTFFDKSLGVPLAERNYGQNCEFNWSNFKLVFFDQFFIAHLIGWWGKAIMFRDWILVLAMSFLFELMEYSLEHVLPNFIECWWDHWLADFLGCNLLGIILGMKTLKYFEIRKYNWTAFQIIPTNARQLARNALQFTPETLDQYNWDMFGHPTRFVGFLFVAAACTLVDLNAFFLKTTLWIPPENHLNHIRLCCWFIWGQPALREYYQFIADKNTKKIGTQAWVCILILLMECLIWAKFSRLHLGAKSDFPQYVTPPAHVVWGWAIGLFVFFLCAFIFFVRKYVKNGYSWNEQVPIIAPEKTQLGKPKTN